MQVEGVKTIGNMTHPMIQKISMIQLVKKTFKNVQGSVVFQFWPSRHLMFLSNAHEELIFFSQISKWSSSLSFLKCLVQYLRQEWKILCWLCWLLIKFHDRFSWLYYLSCYHPHWVRSRDRIGVINSKHEMFPVQSSPSYDAT